jgi:ATP-dependent helicase Lhr and Lhr-like helicase
MNSVFARFPPHLQEAVASRLGWSTLRPVQERAGHALLDGQNAIILAPTAGGKTEAAIFPMLARLIERAPAGVGLLYIAPLRALLNNQAERLRTYTSMVRLRRFLWHGNIKDSQKRAFLKEPAEVLMTTPESLEVMLLSPRVPHPKLFRDVHALIVDEVHALAGTDRGAHLMSVCERLVRHTTNDVQRIGLSATVGNPTTILTWLQGTSRREGCVINPPQAPSKKDIRICLRQTISAIARDASRLAVGQKSLFFCQSRALTEAIAPNTCADAGLTCSWTTVRSHSKGARPQKSAFIMGRIRVLSAPQPWNSGSTSGISTSCSRLMPPQRLPPSSNAWAARGAARASAPIPPSSAKIPRPSCKPSPS